MKFVYRLTEKRGISGSEVGWILMDERWNPFRGFDCYELNDMTLHEGAPC